MSFYLLTLEICLIIQNQPVLFQISHVYSYQ